MSPAKFRTSRGHVAVKNMVCRLRGILARILRIWGSKPMSSMRSASSKTRQDTPSSRTWPPSRKSFKRPGHATMVCTPHRYFLYWSFFGAPPYMATTLKPMAEPKRSASASVCCASSLVGDITRSPGPCLSGLWPCLRISQKAGNKKASVLPLPVAAMPITSLPWRASGQVNAWICEGPGKPARLNCSWISYGNSRISLKELIFTGCTGRSSGPITLISLSATQWPLLSPRPAESQASLMLRPLRPLDEYGKA
mmetsp:Transcript_42269/g.51997  ORF Transcript_42269/g.51997 Transcript_42269/m.51997 type:complete len:253 (-) Transcript_42269:107-865(-)